MNSFLRNLLVTGLVTTMFGCADTTIEPTESASAELPATDFSFNYQSTRDIELSVKVSNAGAPGERFRINVYNDVPSPASLMTAGLTDANQQIKLALRTPAPLQFLYIQKISAYGVAEVLKVPVSEKMTADFGVTRSGARLAATGPDCSTGVNRPLANFNGSVDVNPGDVVALSGTFNGSINMNGGTVRICGKATITGVTMNNPGSAIYILESADVTASNFNMNNAATTLYNYSSKLEFPNGVSFGGSVENNGTMTVKGDLNINNNSSNALTNNGTLTVSGNLNNNRSLTNNKTIVVSGHYQANGGSMNVNTCSLFANQLTINSNLHNRSYVKVTTTTTVNGGTFLRQYDGALLSTHDLMENGTISGEGAAKSTVKVAGNTTINGGAVISGNINLCDLNGVETNNASIAPTFLSCSNYIATSACNPEGFGQAPVADRDKDGVPDSLDDFPDDAKRAFRTFYPSASGTSTYAFEDMWPLQGDYDFNDLVVNFRVTRVLNADNKVVDLKQNLTISAIGASFDNGFGFQLDGVSSADVASVTGSVLTKGMVTLNANKTEAGQSKAVIIAYDSPESLIKRAQGSMFNTVKATPVAAPGELELLVTFATPQDPAKLTQDRLNPFLFVNSNRKKEVHLPNYLPTALADATLFGTGADATKPSENRYYKTAQNFPWALEIPNQFRYPVETVAINKAFNKFNTWVASKGAQNQDWFEDKAGYINPDKVFK
ncbi:LruC domain-containing protein [Tellurirhabdus rosea]|uniref:LruC domain-containing protein n=1 Tax=Tellurirhabdus rosea TaxID=2674997 RepID=UPI00225C2D3C|nr:LruC domain-containing protein [Tellurirhabdus rosea]